MKPKQNLKQGKVMFRFAFLTIAFFSFLLLSCNNDAKKPKEGNPEDTTVNGGGGKPAPTAISTFRKFRILKTNLNLIQYRKMTLVPGFDDLADPKTMSLYYFQITPLGGVGVANRADDKSDGDAAPFNTSNLILSNNEIVFADYDWPNIDYLVLEPARDATHPDNLGYNIRAFRFSGSEGVPDTEVMLTPQARSAKPSPPAPPALYKK